MERPNDGALTPEAKEYIQFQDRQIAELTSQLNYLRKLYFGKKSEKQPLSIPAECDQLSIFDEAEATADSKTEDLPRQTDTTVREHTRAKRRSREEILAGMPTEVHEYDLAPENRGCPHCGHEMEKVGRELIRKECDYIPAHVEVHEYYCATYTCRNCLGEGEGCADCQKPTEACKDCKNGPRTVFVKAPLPPEKRYPVFAHSLASAGTVAYVLYAKYVQAIPLYRQVKDWEMAGLVITRATLANWVILCHRDYFQYLVAYLRKVLLMSDVLHSDETPVNVLDEKNRVNSQMWVYRTGACEAHPIVIYDYQPSWEAKHPKRFLDGFTGYLVTDGMASYPVLKTVTNCGCWAHLRREFLKPTGGKIPEEGTGLRKGFDLVEALFMLEREFRDLFPDARLHERRKRSTPILEKFWSWCTSENRLKSDTCHKPIGYATNQKQALCVFLLDGRIPITNNDAENAIRSFVVGRKNWLFCNTTNGAQASASVYSIVETAKANGLNPFQYFKFLLERMPSADRHYSDAFLSRLMPWCVDAQTLCRQTPCCLTLTVFRCVRPLRYQWYIDESDEKMFIQAMDAAAAFAEILNTKGYWEIMREALGRPLKPKDMITGDILAYTKIPLLVKLEEGKYDLSFQELPDHMDEHFTAPVLSNDLEIARLRGRMKTDVTLQCSITCLPMSIRDETGEAPHVPMALIMVAVRETPKAYVAETVALEMAVDYEGGVGKWMSAFCSFIEANGRPRAVLTNGYRTEHLLKRLCTQLGIRFTYQKGPLRELDDAIRKLQDRLLHGDGKI